MKSEGNDNGVVGKIVGANGSPVASAAPPRATRALTERELFDAEQSMRQVLPLMTQAALQQAGSAQGIARPDGMTSVDFKAVARLAAGMAWDIGVAAALRRSDVEREYRVIDAAAVPSGAGGSGGGA